MMKADIFEVTFWVNAGLPKVCGFNSFPFTEVQQTNLFKCKIIYAYHLNESQNHKDLPWLIYETNKTVLH